MRFIVVLLLAFPLFAKPFEVTADLSRLTSEQREWLLTFEAGARLHTAQDVPASDWIRASASSAREILPATAKYLDAAADVLQHAGSEETLERTFRETMGAPVYVMVRILDGLLADIVVAIPSRTRLPDIPSFEHMLPGFQPQWTDPVIPEERSRIATLQFRAGKAAGSSGPATYLPFDASLNAKVGRTWIVYDNLLPAGWFTTRVLPAAEALIPPVAHLVKANAFLLWYATRPPMYDAGPNLTPEQLGGFGSDKNALRIAKADVLCAMANGASDEDLATLLAVTFDTLHEAATGKAPPPHKTASAMLVTFGVERGALRFENDQWIVDLAALRTAVRELAAEILAIESSLDTNRGRLFVACYGTMTPELERTVAILAALPKTTIEPRYAPPSPEFVVRSYLASPTREDALAHLSGEFRKTASAMLRWDFALHPTHRIETMNVRDDTAIVRAHETNDFARLLDFPGWTAVRTFRVHDGRIVEERYEPVPDQPKWQPYLDQALPWLRAHRAEMLARAYPDGQLNREAAGDWVAMLMDWRAATGRK
ncbi:MAG TPA: hypothetical protein VKB93_16145 [Thermoanaerobaculia bacterium]|nr:hypothetical protein [Thermoanaerobaculia bacterium]